MSLRVVDIKKVDTNNARYGEFARKPCLIKTLNDGIPKEFYKFLDEEEILELIENYRNYLNSKKRKIVDKEYTKTFRERMRNHVKALPFYIVSIALLILACMSGVITGFLLMTSGIGLSILTYSVANHPISEDVINALPEVKNINKLLEDSSELEELAKREIEFKYNHMLIRKKIDEAARKKDKTVSPYNWNRFRDAVTEMDRRIQDILDDSVFSLEENDTHENKRR